MGQSARLRTVGALLEWKFKLVMKLHKETIKEILADDVLDAQMEMMQELIREEKSRKETAHIVLMNRKMSMIMRGLVYLGH